MPKALLLRRPSGLYVRLLVPKHLRPLVGSRYIVRSLGGLHGDAARLAAARLGYHLGLAWAQGNPAVPDFRKFELRGTPGLPDFSLKTDGTAADSAAALEALKLLAVPRLPDPAPTPPLGRRVALFLKQFRQQGYHPGTVMDTVNSMRVLLAVVPKATPVGDLSNAHLDALLAFLPKIPVNARKLKAFRDMPLRAAAARATKIGAPTIDTRTQQKHLDRIGVLFSWLYMRREIDAQLCEYQHSLRADNHDGGEAQARRPFSDAELAAIFAPAMRARCKHPAQWWGPLIALYTGARASEIANLRTDSIEEINGIWGFHFMPLVAGQRVKNKGSKRFVPVHPALLDAGLVAYRDELRAFLYSGDGALLPNLNATHPGDSLGDWFNRTLLRKWCGIDDDRLVFHCFRNTFSSRAARVPLPDPDTAALTGHGAPGTVLRENYIDALTLPERDANLRRITFPAVPLTPYQPGQFRAYLSKVLHNKRHLERRAARK